MANHRRYTNQHIIFACDLTNRKVVSRQNIIFVDSDVAWRCDMRVKECNGHAYLDCVCYRIRVRVSTQTRICVIVWSCGYMWECYVCIFVCMHALLHACECVWTYNASSLRVQHFYQLSSDTVLPTGGGRCEWCFQKYSNSKGVRKDWKSRVCW